MHKVKYLFLLAFIMAAFGSFNSAANKEKLQWLTLSEAASKMQTEKKPLLIDLYTDWCGWCKVMDKKTYTHQELIKYVNEKFYPVKIDAETRDKISWKGRDYIYQPTYKINSYALFLTGGQLEFPTTVILLPDGTDPQAISGYMKPNEMEIFLKFFGEGKFGKVSFRDYEKDFKATWK